MAIFYTYNQTFFRFCAPSSQVVSKYERKVVMKLALEPEKSMHSLCPIDRANKLESLQARYARPHNRVNLLNILGSVGCTLPIKKSVNYFLLLYRN